MKFTLDEVCKQIAGEYTWEDHSKVLVRETSQQTLHDFKSKS